MAFTNQKIKLEVSDENILEKSLIFIEKALGDAGTARKFRLKTVMTAEESIAQLLAHADPEGSLRIHVTKFFGDAKVLLEMPGEEFDPYADAETGAKDLQDLGDEDALTAIRSIYLKAQGENLKFGHKKGTNSIRILTGETERSMLRSTLIALVLGLLFGYLLQAVVPETISAGISKYALTPVKTMFMNALKIIIAPVVFFSIVSCMSQFKDLSQLGRIGSRVMGMYMLTTVFAVLVGMGLFLLIKPGVFGFALTMTGAVEEVVVDTTVDTSLLGTLVAIVPANFLRPFLESDTLQIIFLAFLCGIAVGMIGEYSELLKNFFEACNSLFLTITILITKVIPLAVFCSMALMILDLGGSSFLSVLGMGGVSLLGLFCMICIYGLLILILGHLNPLTFFRKNKEGMVTSLTLSSSSAAMPTNMRVCTDKLGISSKVCSFSIPLGATINMDGSCVFLSVAGLFLARAYGVDVPGSAFLSLAITIILLSLGCPGVPGAGIVCLGVVLGALGVPVEGIGIIMGIHPILDMFITMSNTTGDVTAALIVAKKENLLDLEKYKDRS